MLTADWKSQRQGFCHGQHCSGHPENINIANIQKNIWCISVNYINLFLVLSWMTTLHLHISLHIILLCYWTSPKNVLKAQMLHPHTKTISYVRKLHKKIIICCACVVTFPPAFFRYDVLFLQGKQNGFCRIVASV